MNVFEIIIALLLGGPGFRANTMALKLRQLPGITEGK